MWKLQKKITKMEANHEQKILTRVVFLGTNKMDISRQLRHSYLDLNCLTLDKYVIIISLHYYVIIQVY